MCCILYILYFTYYIYIYILYRYVIIHHICYVQCYTYIYIYILYMMQHIMYCPSHGFAGQLWDMPESLFLQPGWWLRTLLRCFTRIGSLCHWLVFSGTWKIWKLDVGRYCWVNYNDLTVLPNPGNHGLYMGNHPQMALIQVSEIL